MRRGRGRRGKVGSRCPPRGVSHAVVVLPFFYTFHIRPAHMPQAGACVCGGLGVEGWESGVGFARRAVRKYVANSTAH